MNLFKKALINSLGTGIYIALVAMLMTYGNQFFGQGNSILGGIGVLLLFTLSALIVGTLVLGKPLMFYLDGQKKEAVKLLLYTIIFLAILTIVFLGIVAIIKA